MFVKKVRLKSFRNLEDQEITLGQRINVFVGSNGQGKTGFLESIYLCSHGKSFRTSKQEHLVKHGDVNNSVDLWIVDGQLDDHIHYDYIDKRKSFSKNGKRTSSSNLNEILPTVLFSPESLQSIKEGPEQRRKLVDEWIVSFDPINAEILSEFEKAYRTKSKLLRDTLDGRVSRREARQILESLLPGYLERAVLLTNRRLEAVKAIKKPLEDTYRAVSNDKTVEISVDYVISEQIANAWSHDEVKNAMHKRQTELIENELDSGQVLVGPQRHEIRFLYNRNDSRFFCSQGQQRTIVLSFKIGQILHHKNVHNRTPVLLLDDVLSELDTERRSYLVKFLKESSAQTIITTTDLSLCLDLRGENLSEFNVKNGLITRA